MTARAPARSLQAQLKPAYRRVRLALVARHACRAAAQAIVMVALGLVAGTLLPVSPATAWTRLSLVVLGLLAALILATRAFMFDAPGWDSWLEAVEQRFPEVRSLLRNALDFEHHGDAHTSTELASAVRAEASQRLAATPLAQLTPPLAPRRAMLWSGAAAVAIAATVMLAPLAALRSWQTLWSPESAAPPVSLTVEPGDVTVSPGATLAVRAKVSGTASAPRLLGDGPAPVATLESEAAGVRRWRFDLPPVTRARDYSVRAVRAQSPRYRIALAGEPLPVSFRIEMTAPAYARLPVQSSAATRGDLSALRGSRAQVEVTFDRDLESLTAAVGGGGARAWKAVTPRRWRGEVPVASDGEYRLDASSASGRGQPSYRITALTDAPPVVTVAAPLGDQDLPTGQNIPYDVLVEDDLGLSELRLQFHKEAGSPWRDVPLAAFRSEPRQARVSARWDAATLALLPGEVGTFRFEVWDNDRVVGRKRTVSSEFRLRFPSLADLYQNLDERQENVQKALEKVAEQAKELQKSMDQMQRQQPQRNAAPSPQFERAEEMKRAIERQKDLAQKLDDAAEQMKRNLDEAAERQAFREDLQNKLKQMSELLKEIRSQEFKDALERMQKAMEKMDRREMDQTLPQLRQENKDMMKNLERSIEQLKQLREEERLEALAKKAEELKAQQDALNREHQANAKQPPAGQSPKAEPNAQAQKQAAEQLAQKQQAAAQKSEQLAKEAQQAAEQSENPPTQEALAKASEQLQKQAAQQQKQAAQQAEQQQSQQATKSGQQASQSLEQAAQMMSQASESQQQRKQSENVAAVRRAAQDLVSLERATQQNMKTSGSQKEQADRQTDLSEGVARVADSLSALAKETPMLNPKAQEALGKAQQGLAQSGKDMSGGNRHQGEMSAKAASAALNEAVASLRESESQMCNKPGMGKPGQTGAKKVGDIGEQQSQLNQRSREMARKMSQQMRMDAGDQAEIRRLADEQQRIREQLANVQRDEEAKKSLLGRLDQTQKEMKEVEEQLRQGSTDGALEEKQTKILSRLLDAQRSLNRRDFDPEREARRAEDISRPSPAALPTDLLRENDRLRQDLMKVGADRYPAQYRAFIEAYLRTLGGNSR
ncbi:MAG: hypothetical protein ABIU54_09195 [Candidatus Eisenbacteria bacterium]